MAVVLVMGLSFQNRCIFVRWLLTHPVYKPRLCRSFATFLGFDAHDMGFHNHLHAKNAEEHEVAPHVYPFMAVLGLVAMIFTIIGNIMQTKEMYPSYLQSNEGAVFHVPISFFFSIFSDLCLVFYGIMGQDITIILYSVLNSTVILLTMVYIRQKHVENENKQHLMTTQLALKA